MPQAAPVAIQIGERFSIILWGKRRSLTPQNGGKPQQCSKPVSAGPLPTRTHFASVQKDILKLSAEMNQMALGQQNVGASGPNGPVTGALQGHTTEESAKKKPAKKKSRLQGALGGAPKKDRP